MDEPGRRRSKEGSSILATRYRIEPMEQADVAEVSRVERRCFENPWPVSAYRRELRNVRQNYYVVLRVQPDERETVAPARASGFPPRLGEGLRARLPLPRRSGFLGDAPHIAGFAGMWCVYDEAHITTIGVDPHYRGRSFGELLLLAMFDEAIRRGAIWVTLEVRVSNRVAQRLYEKYGMSVQSIRKRYYSDDGEDAFVMWSQSLRDPNYRDEINQLREELRMRVGPEIDVPDPPSPPWRGPDSLQVTST
jgi:ribosomal-protein-alanine N-acetyltransferase